MYDPMARTRALFVGMPAPMKAEAIDGLKAAEGSCGGAGPAPAAAAAAAAAAMAAAAAAPGEGGAT